MAIFSRKPTLDEAIATIREELRDRPGLPEGLAELQEILRRRQAPLFPGSGSSSVDEILEALPDAAALLEGEGRIMLRNKHFAALLGDRRSTVVEATRSGEVHELATRATGGWPAQKELDLPGLNLRVLVTAAPLGKSRGLLVLRDLTAERRAEAIRRDFIANASHELRTPVTAISGAAETLLHGGLAVDDQSRHFVEMIARHATRLSRLAQDLLDLSRLESGDWKPQLESVELLPVFETVAELVRPRAHEKQIALNSDVPSSLRVRGDRRAIEQVLLNLLDNALKFTPEGGRVTLLADDLGGQVMVSVVDTGPGIEPRHQTRIFERFYRVDAGRSREVGGTGLGLAIVKHLVQGMAGEVGLESGRGGSRFWVKLPRASA